MVKTVFVECYELKGMFELKPFKGHFRLNTFEKLATLQFGPISL